MADPTRSGVDRAVEESMDLFKRAQVGSVDPIVPRRPTSVLLALDGSTQDRLSEVIAGRLRKRFGCEIAIVDAREDEATIDLASHVAESVGGQAAPKGTGNAFEQILEAVDHSKCDLVITPCPYGRDLDAVGPDSAGTVIDVLLARSPVPILVVRKPYENTNELFQQVIVVLTAENDMAPDAAAWATGLIGKGGELQLVLILERETAENIQALMQSIAPDMEISASSLSHALASNYMKLHRRLQKAATEKGFGYKLIIQVEGVAGSSELTEENPRQLIVLALERSDHASQGNVQGRIRQSHNPVLVACRGRWKDAPTTDKDRMP